MCCWPRPWIWLALCGSSVLPAQIALTIARLRESSADFVVMPKKAIAPTSGRWLYFYMH